jgi:hypothetical protein
MNAGVPWIARGDVSKLGVEEGMFEGEQWVAQRRLNGDERHIELPERSTVLRFRVNRL